MIKDKIHDSVFNGRIDLDEDSYTWRAYNCDYCNNAAETYKVKGYDKIKDIPDNYFSFHICGDCLYEIKYGDNWSADTS